VGKQVSMLPVFFLKAHSQMFAPWRVTEPCETDHHLTMQLQERDRTLSNIRSKYFVEGKHLSCFFPILKRINNHDISIFSNVVHSRLPIRLPSQEGSDSTIDPDCSCSKNRCHKMHKVLSYLEQITRSGHL